MKRLLVIIALVALLPTLSWGDDAPKKVLIIPLKQEWRSQDQTFSQELSQTLANELMKEGDVQPLSGAPFATVVDQRRVDVARIGRIAQRTQADVVIWGRVSKLDSGYSLELSVLDTRSRKPPKVFSATGKNVEELLSRMKDLAANIGTTALGRPVIGEIKIEGNRRIEPPAILNKMEMKPGTPFRQSALGKEIREIYSMGYFDDVQINTEETPDGKIDLHVILKERPSIRKLEVTGNSVFTKDEILDALTTKSFSVANQDKIRQDIGKLKRKYEGKGYYEPKIDYEVKEVSPSEADLTFKMDEGSKSFLTEIVLDGAKKLQPADIKKDLKDTVGLKEKSWIWFLDESGAFTREKLDQARMRLMQYYLDHGFINVQVGFPELDIHDGAVKVTYPIREGAQFQVRKVNVDGDLRMPREQLIEKLDTKPKTWFSRSSMASDIKTLTKIYNNLGYAYVDVEPKTQVNDKYNFVDIDFKINEGKKVSIERVDIAGNERTRGKVIRRGLEVVEGDLYNADKFDATKKNLESMDFFEAVKLKTSPGSRPDLMNVTVEVMEKKTGSLTAGLGYSSQDGAMGNVDLKERNLLGMGILANAKASISGRRNSYEGSLTYPWMFDYPLTGSVRAYHAQQRENNYLRDGEGFSVNLGYPLYGLWQMSTGFSRDSTKLTRFEKGFGRSVTEYYRRYGTDPMRYTNFGQNTVSVSFARDTRIGAMIPTGGSKVTFGTRLAGFGGDVAYSSYFSEAIYYHPLVWKAILKLRASGSLLQEVGKDPIPFDQRIVLGGIQSIRGYRSGEIGPKDKNGFILGGDRSFYTNVECLFPLIEQLKINAVAFIDAGNAWNVSDSPLLTEIKSGVGLGIRWMSPMGPIRLEYGWKINPKKGEEAGVFAFGMGQLF
jgi:outer membrane protein insertion porin family